MFSKNKIDDIRDKLYEIIFGTETRTGKLFDLVLLIAILLSILLAMLESVKSLSIKYSTFFKIAEWIITVFFSLEYITRLLISKKPLKYAFSFYGIVDLLSTFPTYITLLSFGHNYSAVIRIIRLLRVFRILKLSRQLKEAQTLATALLVSRHKITVFLLSVIAVVTIIGTLMYSIEGENNGFDSIPKSIYWAIVTITTVGFGDITPKTALGQSLAAFLMLIGYAIIAVPTGIVTAEMMNPKGKEFLKCQKCDNQEENIKSKFCKWCGEPFKVTPPNP